MVPYGFKFKVSESKSSTEETVTAFDKMFDKMMVGALAFVYGFMAFICLAVLCPPVEDWWQHLLSK